MQDRHFSQRLLFIVVFIMATPFIKITESFPVKVLSPIATSIAPPSYATIQLAQTQLNSNATSVPSQGGDGVHGHLALTVTPARYAELSNGNVAFVAPINPPIDPVHGANATAFQIAENIRQHKAQLTTFRTYHDVDKALRNMLIDAVHPVYIRALYDTSVGFGNVTTLQLLTHLWTHYGVITQDELDANNARMSQAWSPPTPIEVLFTQLEEGVIFATAGGEVPAPAAVVRMGYNIVEATGLFETPCREWRKLPPAQKTMAEFQILFRQADTDRRRNITSSSAGFQGANKATTQPPATLAPVITTLKNIALGYCWTHGCSKNVKHTSVTCKNKADGHQDDATISDKKGGSTKIWGPKQHE